MFNRFIIERENNDESLNNISVAYFSRAVLCYEKLGPTVPLLDSLNVLQLEDIIIRTLLCSINHLVMR